MVLLHSILSHSSQNNNIMTTSTYYVYVVVYNGAMRKLKKPKAYYGAGILMWVEAQDKDISVLLGKRSIHPGKGKWSIPGGGWSRREDGFDKQGHRDYVHAAIRETREELRFDIDNPESLIPLWRCHIPYFHFEVFSYHLRNKMEFNYNHEFREVRWVSVQNLPVPYVWFLRLQVAALERLLFIS